MKSLLSTLLALLLAFSACEKKRPPTAEALHLRDRIELQTNELKKLDAEIQKAKDDAGRARDLTHNLELLRSRLERDKAQLLYLDPELTKEMNKPPEGEAHH